MIVTNYHDSYKLALAIAQRKDLYVILQQLDMTKKEIGQIAIGLKDDDRLRIRDGLQELTAIGLVSTLIHKNVKPMQIEYALTNRGAKLLKALKTMQEVSLEIMDAYGIEDTYTEKND